MKNINNIKNEYSDFTSTINMPYFDIFACLIYYIFIFSSIYFLYVLCYANRTKHTLLCICSTVDEHDSFFSKDLRSKIVQSTKNPHKKLDH
jgi:hypothetical protein